jgi:hypothetical protein
MYIEEELALRSPRRGSCLVGIVCSLTQALELSFLVFMEEKLM